MTVIAGYRDWPGVSCPYCGGSHGSVEDEGERGLYTYRCWCGATAKVRQDDPDLVAALPRSEESDPYMTLE